MLRRTRDVLRGLRPQQKISYEEWQNIVERDLKAREFFSDENIVYQIMKESLTDAESIVLENRVREVHEEMVVSANLKKVFITPQKVQLDELVGKIKFIRDLFAQLQSWIEYKENLEKKEGDGSIFIERNVERHEV